MTDPEKSPLIAQAQAPCQLGARRRQVSWRDIFLLSAIILCTIPSLIYLYDHPYPPHLAHHFNKNKPTPTWNSGKPIYRSKNSTIPWWPCPDRPPTEMQYCSMLEVPMNWLEPKEGEVTKVFMRMVPAEEGKRLGSMLINPGGESSSRPGGSGNQFAYRAGKSLSVLTDGRYDIIGFDPRGINMTQPRLSVMPTDFDRAVFDLGSKKPAIAHDPTKGFNVSKPRSYESELHRLSTLDTYYSLQKNLIDNLHPESHLASVSTAFVVRDMVAILDGLGEGEELLNYWGFSYGTILGATFAAMFPERVGRMVLDGVSNAEHYTSSLWEWGYSTLTDNNAVYQEFFLTCAQAGSSRCALSPNSTYDSLTETERATMVQESVIGLLHKLYEKPMEVKEGKSGPGILDYEMYHYILMNLAYSPSTWQSAAHGISQALSGNATYLYNTIPRYTAPATIKQGPKNDTDNVFGMPVGGDAAQSGILCTDLPENEMGLGDYVELGQMYRERGFAGEEWGTIALPCRTWHSRPYERYSGPWHHSQGLRKTRNKVLFVGNTFDPVTPLISARKMAEGFGEGSASVLVHEGHGHCSIAEPSLCTIENIRAYLVEGRVPKYNTTCKAEPGFLFPAPVSKQAEFSVAEKKRNDMLDAVRRVQGAQLAVMKSAG